MAEYTYRVVTREGKEKKGTIHAKDKDRAIGLLKAEGNIVIKIDEANLLSKDIELPFLQQKVKPRDLSVLCRQFVSIISAGVSIVHALRMLKEQTENKVLKKALDETQTAVEKGETLAHAMAQNKEVFTPIFIHMVEAGEASGSLETAFLRMSEHFEKDAKLKAMIKKSMIYPIAVLVVAVIIVVILMIYVIPNFITMFEGMNTQLPLPTRIVIAMSDFFANRWYVILLAVFFAVVGFRVFASTKFGMYFLADIGIKAPLFGKLAMKSSSASLARTLGTLLAAGVSVVEALQITSSTMTNLRYKDALLQAKESVSKGIPMSEPLQKSGLFPPMVYHMIGIGEETGNLEQLLGTVANYYEEEVEFSTQAMMAVLEPLMIVILALLVGGILGAVMMPMMQLYDSVGGM